ncbi:hypothetical protein F5Y01DRAFT_315794 [Xylaria sp. FL0043]|nr:hypothetical protein F5Y01DRAFT_315794 [Xylaria sp. FL0043]
MRSVRNHIAKTGQAETDTVAGDSGVNAWGIAILSTPSKTPSSAMASTPASMVGMATSNNPTSSPASVSNQSSTSSSTSTPIATSSAQSLSAGAAVGIGVGVGLGALAILGFLIFWLLRRRYEMRQRQPVAHFHQNGDQAAQNMQSYYAPTGLQAPSPNMEWKYQQQQYANLSNQDGSSELDVTFRAQAQEMQG